MFSLDAGRRVPVAHGARGTSQRRRQVGQRVGAADADRRAARLRRRGGVP